MFKWFKNRKKKEGTNPDVQTGYERSAENVGDLIPTEMDNPEAAEEPEYYNPMVGVEAPDKTPYDRGGSVVFENVTFTYPNSGSPALRNISLEIRSGETFSVVGPAGCGKSTLARLISRFFDASEGTVRVDGIDVRKYEKNALQERIVYAARENGLSADSFSANAAAEILILDGVNESLPPEAEAALTASLKENFSEITKIILSKKVTSGVMQSDHIAVMDSGQIAGCGTHDDLLKNCSIYRDFCGLPPQEEEDADDTEVLEYMDPDKDAED